MGKLVQNQLFTLIHGFLTDYLPQKRNCSPHTVKAYRTALDQLLDFAKGRKGIRLAEVTFGLLDDGMVAAYLDWLEEEKQCSIRTRNHRLQCLRAFYAYTAMMDKALTVYQLSLGKIPLKETEKAIGIDHLSEKAVSTLLVQPDTHTEKWIRNQCIMVLMYDTAARAQEITGLKIRDIRFGDTPTAMFHGKGNKYRTVPLEKNTVAHLRRYMALFHPGEPDYSEAPLFYTIRKNMRAPISDDSIRVFLDKYAESARIQCPEIPEKIYPHIFRHSRAMHLYQRGMDLTLLSQWLGHSNLSTTLIYAYADTEMKRKAIEKATKGQCRPEVTGCSSSYDVNDDDVLKRLYGLKP